MRKFVLLFAALCVPLAASAHEVYVLSTSTIAHSLTMPPLELWGVISDNSAQFFFWAFISLWAVITIFSISILKPVERWFSPTLNWLKPYAPVAARITLGIAIAASGWFNAFFGPELPIEGAVPASIALLVRGLLMVGGLGIVFNIRAREISFGLAGMYLLLWLVWGSYMLTYSNYFGEMLLIAGIGGSFKWLEKYSFLIMRMGFGISLAFASLYAKLLHAELALQVVREYNLTNYFHFAPEFVVLGAFCIELLLGIFFVFGIEIRFASLFLLFWLTLSLVYFGESVWPHIIIAGAAVAIFMRGYDEHTIQLRLLRRLFRTRGEPVF